MARKSKPKKVKEQRKVSGLRINDFRFPGEMSSYWTGIIGTAILFAWLAALGFFTIKNAAGQKMWYIPLEIMAYPVLAFLICNSLAAKPRAAQLKKAGRQARVMSNNFAELYRVLVKQSSALGLKTPPDMYLVHDDHPVLYSLAAGRGTIIASDSLQEAVTPDEFEALLAHEITHIVAKHVRIDLAQTFIRSSNIALKVIFFPVLLMGVFGRAWCELIEFTADRGALLITLKPAVLNTAIVKFAVVRDPNAGIGREELQAYLDSAGDITTDATQMERHFKVGQFMNSQPGLRERIEQISDFMSSDEGKALLTRSAEQQGVALSAMPSYNKKADDGIEHVIDETGDQSM